MVWAWLLCDFPPPCFLLAYLSPDPPSFLQFLKDVMFISTSGSFVSAWNFLPSHLLRSEPFLPSTSWLNYHFLMPHYQAQTITSFMTGTFILLVCLCIVCFPWWSGSPMQAGTCWPVPCCVLIPCHCPCSVAIPWRSACHRVALWGKCVGHPPSMRPTENAGPPHLSLWQDVHFLALWPHYLLLYLVAQNFAYPS